MTSSLSNWEWTLTWSSLEFFLTQDEYQVEYWISQFLNKYEARLSNIQRDDLSNIIRNSIYSNPIKFSNFQWRFLVSYLDVANRYLVEVEGAIEKITCFEHNGEYFNVELYRNDPTEGWYVVQESITNCVKISEMN
jgi:hypothetical protein